MNEIEALHWAMSQPGLKIYVGHTSVTITIEGHVHAEGESFLAAAILAQKIIKNMRHKSEKEQMRDWEATCARGCQ